MVIDPTSMHVLFIQHPPRTQVSKHKIKVLCFGFLPFCYQMSCGGLEKVLKMYSKKKKKKKKKKKEKKNVDLVLITNSMTLGNFLNLGSCEDQIK